MPWIYNPNSPDWRDLTPSQKFLKQNDSWLITLITCFALCDGFACWAYYMRQSGRYAYNQR